MPLTKLQLIDLIDATIRSGGVGGLTIAYEERILLKEMLNFMEGIGTTLAGYTGSFVTIGTTQTITGVKTFDNPILNNVDIGDITNPNHLITLEYLESVALGAFDSNRIITAGRPSLQGINYNKTTVNQLLEALLFTPAPATILHSDFPEFYKVGAAVITGSFYIKRNTAHNFTLTYPGGSLSSGTDGGHTVSVNAPYSTAAAPAIEDLLFTIAKADGSMASFVKTVRSAYPLKAGFINKTGLSGDPIFQSDLTGLSEMLIPQILSGNFSKESTIVNDSALKRLIVAYPSSFNPMAIYFDGLRFTDFETVRTNWPYQISGGPTSEVNYEVLVSKNPILPVTKSTIKFSY